ncbi:protein BNIP5 [Talpa occidentalis]|uniref:protein BNIP5 n=1 Tax=Talpa occidentalis TaxID=50954 RepID=UPI0023F9F671|nr:protein BNIP5 [Talpa occidentalis]
MSLQSVSRDRSDLHGLSMLENPQGSAPSGKARSLDNTPSRASRARSPESPVQPAEAQVCMAAAPSVEASSELLPSEQSTPPDAKKDKTQKWHQQGWVKSFLNFFLRSGPEEPKEKADRTKGKEGLPQITEIPVQPVVRKKSHDKKASRKKHSHRKSIVEEITVVQDQEAEGQEAGLSTVAAAWGSKKEANLDPAGGGGEDSDLYHPGLIKRQGSGVSAAAPQDSGHQSEETPRKSDRDSIIQTIVELIKKVADYCEKENGAGAADASNLESQPPRRPSHLPPYDGNQKHPISSSSDMEKPKVQVALTTEGGDLSPLEAYPGAGCQEPEEDLPLDKVSESKETIIQIIVEFLKKEELQVSQPEVVPQNSASAPRKKSQEKKLTLKRVFSYKKYVSEEPRKVGAAGAASPESRPHKRTSFLTRCVEGHRPSVSTSDIEEPKVQDALTIEGGDLSPLEGHPGAGRQEHEEDLSPDRVSESKDAIIQMIVEFLKKVGDQYEKEELPQPKVVPQNPAPPPRKKSQEKKISFKRVFSHKKYGSEEPKKVEAAGGASLESRPPKRPSFHPLCGVGQRTSSSTSDPEPEPEVELQESLPAEGVRIGASEAAPQAGSHKAEAGPQQNGACEFKEKIFQKLAAILQEVSDQLRDQIRRNPGLKKYFREILDASLEKLVTSLQSQEACSTELNRSHVERPYQLSLGLPNKFADNNSHNVISLMDFTGHYGRRHSCGQFSYREAQQNITSPEIQSPD